MPNDQPSAVGRPEAPAVATRAVILTAIGLLLFVGISLVLLHVYYRDHINQAVFVPPTPFAKPQLQTNDDNDLAKLHAEQGRRLRAYTWLDRDKGVIAIPIEEAEKRIVARGSDAYAPIEAIAPGDPAVGGKKP